jgi:predicted transcriptional regulator
MNLSRRERQVMEIIYGVGEATATQVIERMADPPSRAAVRTFLRILEDKGQVKHRAVGREFVYRAVAPRQRIGKSMFRRVIETFFHGSVEKALAAYLADPDTEVTPTELQRLQALITEARKAG